MNPPPPSSRSQGDSAVARRAGELVGKLSATRARALATLMVALVLAGLALAYGAGVGGGDGIRVNTDLKALLPKTAPSVAAIDTLSARKGNSELLTVAVQEPDGAARQAMIDALAAEIGTWPETEIVEVGRDFTPLRDHALYLLEAEDLAKLRDTLVKERRRAVARVMRPGITDAKVDPDELLAGDDWDQIGEEEEEPDPPPPSPAGEDGENEDEDLDVREWLDQQKGELENVGSLSKREIDLIWPHENEAGELVWEDQIVDPYLNTAGDVQLVKARLTVPPTDVARAREVVQQLDDAVARLQGEGIAPQARVEVVAAYHVSGQVNTILVDAKRATVLSALLVILVVVLGFRGARALALVVVPMVIAACLTLAIAQAWFAELNALTVFLFAVLFGMGVDFALHMYAQRRAQGPDADWPAVVRDHLRPLSAAMLTTAGSLFVLEVAQFRAFREFGLISGVGVAISFACALVLVPALDTLFGRDRRAQREEVNGEREDLVPAEPRSWRGVRILALAGIAVFAVSGLPGVEFEKDVQKLNAKPPADAKKKLNYGSAVGRCSKSLVLIAQTAEDLDASVAALEAERDAKALLPNGVPKEGHEPAPWVHGVYSVNNAMPTGQAAKAELNAEIAEQANGFLAELDDRDAQAQQYRTHLESLERLAKARPLEVEELPSWAIEPFTERDGRHDRIAHACLEINGNHLDELVAVQARLDTLLADFDVQYADSRLVFADVITDIEADSRRLPLWALGVILVFIAIDLRRPIPTLACFGTLAAGLGLAVGLMGWWPIHLNFFNLVVMPAVVGLGIDASIHLWHARRRATLDATARASLLAALTTAGGFAGLLVARHPGLHSIGVLGVVAVVTCIGVAFFALYPLRRRPPRGD